MYFIDKNYYIRVLFHLFDEGLDALFELTTILCAGHNTRHVEIDDSLIIKYGAGTLVHDKLGNTFNDGALADTGFTNEYRIVLFPATENLYNTLYFRLTTYNRIKFSFSSSLREVCAEIVKHWSS